MSLTQYQDQWYFFQFSDGVSLASMPRRLQVFRNCLHTEKTSLEMLPNGNQCPNVTQFFFKCQILVFFRKLVLLWQYIPFYFSHLDEILHPKQLLIQTDDFFHVGKKTIRSRSNYDLWGCKFLQIYQDMET